MLIGFHLACVWLHFGSLPIFKHKRVPYFVFYSVLVCIAFCLYGFIVSDYKSALILGVILNTCQCGAQLMIDTLVVERVHKETEDEGRRSVAGYGFQDGGYRGGYHPVAHSDARRFCSLHLFLACH